MIAKPIAELLDRLLAAREERRADQSEAQLRVRIALSNGTELCGVPSARTSEHLVLRDGGVEHHVASAHVVAVTLEHADALADLVSDGTRERPQQAQSKLQLQRAFKRVSEALGVSLQAAAIPEGNSARLALTDVLESMQHVLTSIFEEYGDEAHETLHELRIEDASTAGVEKRGEVVVIRADLEGGPRGRLGRDQLERALLAIA